MANMLAFNKVKQARISLFAAGGVLSSVIREKKVVFVFNICHRYDVGLANITIFCKPNTLKPKLELNALTSLALSHVTSCELSNDEVESPQVPT